MELYFVISHLPSYDLVKRGLSSLPKPHLGYLLKVTEPYNGL